MRLIVLHNEAMIADVVCGKEAVHLGSRESCRVQLPDQRIAAQLAIVYPESDGTWLLRQLDRSTAIRVNGRPLVDDQAIALNTDDELQVSDYVIRVYPEHEESPTTRIRLGTSQAQLERFARATLPPGTVLKKNDEALTLLPPQLAPAGRCSTLLAGCGTPEELMDVALQALLESFAAQRAWIGIRRGSDGPLKYVEGRLLTGQPTDMPDVCNNLKPRVLDRAQFALVPRVSAQERCSVLVGPLIGPEGVQGMVYIDSGERGPRFKPDQFDFFVLLLHVIAHQLDAIFKGLARHRAATVEGQISTAHEIQIRLTPRKLPQWEQLQTGAFREPGRQSTGDIYDVLRLSNHLAAFMIAQNSAGGMWPSLLMAQAQTAFRVAVMHQDTPAVFLRTLNWMLYDGQDDHPLDCFAGVIDPPTGQMRFTLAGTLGACIIGQRGEARRLGPREPSPAVGQAKSTVYPLLPEQLEQGETLALFTRGVTTAKDRDQETFGEERFVNLLCDGFGQQASAMMKEMVTDLRNFTEDGSQPDDITVILAHRV